MARIILKNTNNEKKNDNAHWQLSIYWIRQWFRFNDLCKHAVSKHMGFRNMGTKLTRQTNLRRLIIEMSF